MVAIRAETKVIVSAFILLCRDRVTVQMLCLEFAMI